MDSAFALASFVGGILIGTVGLINFFKHVLGDRWCHSHCVGPYLFWNEDDFFDDSNPRFRQTFTLMPKPFGENFGIFFLAYLTLRSHFRMRHEFLNSFSRNSFWFLFLAFFAAFPFAGGFGIVVGFYCCVIAIIGLICRVQGNQGSPNLEISTDSGTSCSGRCGSMRISENLLRWFNMFIALLVVLTMLNNIAHVLKNEFHHWCKDDHDCIGPYLIWPHNFVESVNADKWGSVFSLDLNRGLELWTPMFLALCFLATRNDSWLLTATFLVILAVFGAFGFAGNAGIVIGMLLLFAAGTALLIAIFGGRESHPPGYTLLGV